MWLTTWYSKIVTCTLQQIKSEEYESKYYLLNWSHSSCILRQDTFLKIKLWNKWLQPKNRILNIIYRWSLTSTMNMAFILRLWYKINNLLKIWLYNILFVYKCLPMIFSTLLTCYIRKCSYVCDKLVNHAISGRSRLLSAFAYILGIFQC